jgi:hypothetical protein
VVDEVSWGSPRVVEVVEVDSPGTSVPGDLSESLRGDRVERKPLENRRFSLDERASDGPPRLSVSPRLRTSY